MQSRMLPSLDRFGDNLVGLIRGSGLASGSETRMRAITEVAYRAREIAACDEATS